MMRRVGIFLAALGAAALTMSGVAQAKSNCRNTGNFNTFLADFKTYAKSQGITQSTINRAMTDIYFDPDIVRRDRAQGVFSQTFLQQFS